MVPDIETLKLIVGCAVFLLGMVWWFYEFNKMLHGRCATPEELQEMRSWFSYEDVNHDDSTADEPSNC